MAVVPSLKNLCLNKVVKDNVENYADLPTVLVRAINRTKLFNGIYAKGDVVVKMEDVGLRSDISARLVCCLSAYL